MASSIDIQEMMFEEGVDQPDSLARLVYLIASLSISLPKIVIRYLPFGEEISQFKNGIGVAGSVDELGSLYHRGQSFGEGTRDEAAIIILRLIEPKLGNISHQMRLQLFAAVNELRAVNTESALSDFESTELDQDFEAGDIPKFETGFGPLDIVTQGVYQGLMIVMGNPGTGKTSLMLSLMEELQKKGIPVWFFENEIPGPLMKARVKPMTKRTKFIKGTKLFTGPYSVNEIIELHDAEPDPDRVIIFDSPDVIVGGITGDKRLDIESDYRSLIGLKQRCRLVVVSSQPKRSDAQLSLKSTAESWAKAWYCDMMIGIELNGINQLKMISLKNRFGPKNMIQFFAYDYEHLLWSIAGREEGDRKKGGIDDGFNDDF